MQFGAAHGQRVDAPELPASASGRSAALANDPRAQGIGRMPQRDALLSVAESALASGNTADAVVHFEQAALMLHAADTEMGLVRASMQAGDYRHALAFCAHTAGAHRDSGAAGALYAWLLRAGGQDAYARRVLDETMAFAPEDPVVEETRRAFDAGSSQPVGLLLETPHRMAPQALMLAGQAPPPTGARVVSSGVLIDGGRRALVPIAGLDGAPRAWVRNGLGLATEAIVEDVPDRLRAQGVAVLRLVAPMANGDARLAPRDPFAGSPGFAIEYPPSPAATPAWPSLRRGFLGAFEGTEGLRKLGIELWLGPHGGPVLDAAGRLAGIALRGSGGGSAMLPVSAFREVAHEAPADAGSDRVASPETSARLPADEAYERALKIALQILTLP